MSMESDEESEHELNRPVLLGATGQKAATRNLWAIVGILLPVAGFGCYCLIPMFRMRTGEHLGRLAGLLSVIAVILGILGVCYAHKHGGSGRWRAWLSILLGIWVYLDSAMAVMSLPRERANRVKCASNLRQIGQCIELYAMDHGGQLPSRLDLLITPGELGARNLVCPSSDDTIEGGPLAGLFKHEPRAYVYLGAGLTNSAPGDTVIAYESVENHYGEGMNVLYGDGYVEWIEAKEAERVLAELKAGRNPPRGVGK